MTYLIFGGLGHVGSWIAHDLLERGDSVTIFDSGTAAFDNLSCDYLRAYRDRIQFEDTDVLDTHTLFERMRVYEGKIDAVIFGVAVIAGPNFAKRPFRNIEINTIGMLNVIEACRILGVPKFVNLSSGAVYGNYSGKKTEDTPYMATDLYCATKVSNEVLALQYGSTYDMDIRNARLMAVYGPGKLPSRMHQLYQILFGPLEGLSNISLPMGGDQSMDWTHVRDTAQGVINILDAKDVGGESFNIACGIAHAHKDIVEAARDIVGKDSQMTMGPGVFLDRGSHLDISKAVRTINFKPRFADIRAGLEDYYLWLQKQTTT